MDQTVIFKNTYRFAVALIVVTSARLLGQTPASAPHRVRVVVVVDANTQQPIPDAEVTDLVTGNSTKTSKDGAIGLFVPDFVKATGALLRIRKLGYDPVAGLSVDPLVDTTLVVPLHPSVAELPTVRTAANYRVDRDSGLRSGIDQRCAAAHATCITPDQLMQHQGDLLSDFVKRSGATIPGDDPEPLMHGTMGGGECVPTYFINGLRWVRNATFATPPPGKRPVANPPPSIDQAFRPEDVAAIEIYRPDQPRPMRYSDAPGKVGCGAIVVWTK